MIIISRRVQDVDYTKVIPLTPSTLSGSCWPYFFFFRSGRSYVPNYSIIKSNFKKAGNLKRHLVSSHNIAEDRIFYGCTRCPSRFSTKKQMTRHKCWLLFYLMTSFYFMTYFILWLHFTLWLILFLLYFYKYVNNII